MIPMLVYKNDYLDWLIGYVYQIRLTISNEVTLLAFLLIYLSHLFRSASIFYKSRFFTTRMRPMIHSSTVFFII